MLILVPILGTLQKLLLIRITDNARPAMRLACNASGELTSTTAPNAYFHSTIMIFSVYLNALLNLFILTEEKMNVSRAIIPA